MIRRAFLAGAVTASAFGFGVSVARAENVAPGGSPTTDEGRQMLAAVAAISATMHQVRTAWRPPSLFPPNAPIAYYVGVGGDGEYPADRVIWLNPDHPELISPRLSHVTDDVPLLTELLVASVDVPAPGNASLGLEKLSGQARRDAAFALASRVAVIARFSPYERVDDAEFARRTFAFAVLRQMTPGIGGVVSLVVPIREMPAAEPLVAYAGRDVDSRAPHGWGVIHKTSAAPPQTADGIEAWVRAFVLATADQLPPESEVKRAYDDARLRDDEAGGGDARRRAFAAPYVRQVSALLGR